MPKNNILFIVLFLLAATGAFGSDEAEPGTSAFMPYGSNYFVVGLADFMETAPEYLDTSLIKIGISFRYELFGGNRSNVYLAYSQSMFWDFAADSRPFTEFNLNPEIFWRFQSGRNFLGDVVIPGVEYFQIGVEHNSTGAAGSASRGYERAYGTLRIGIGDNPRLTASGTYYAYPGDLFGENGPPIETRDLQLYRSNFAFELGIGSTTRGGNPFVKRAVLAFGPGGGKNAFDWGMGWGRLDVLFLDLFGGIRPFLQIWSGYGESLVRYDEKSLSVRIGIALN